MKQENVSIVIRTVGERTTQLCKKLVLEQVPEKNVFVINEVPFTKAVKRTFEIGIENGLPWTMAVDADILLTRNAVKDLINLAERESDRVFKFTTKVQDKFFRSPRPGGGHLYRTRLSLQALTLFDGQEYLRPEYRIAELMQEQNGYKHVNLSDCIIGLHDYEQYYKDIYRKAFVYVHKHSIKTLLNFFSYWGEFVKTDPDYRVAFAGLCEGLVNREQIEINIDKLPKDFLQNRLTNDLREKEDLSDENIPFHTCNEVKTLIEQKRGGWCLSRKTLLSKKFIALLGFYLKKSGALLYKWSK